MIDSLVDRADQQRRARDYQAAVQTLRVVLASDATHARAHATLALALLGMRRIAGAEAEAEAALVADGGDPFCHQAAAAVRLAQHRLAEAWGYARVAITDDDDPDARVLAAAIRDASGHRDEARALIDEALELDPGHLAALAAQAGLDLADGQLTDARRRIAVVLGVDPRDPTARVIAARVALAAGDLAVAETHTRFVLGFDAGHRGALDVWMALKAQRGVLLGAWWRITGFMSVRSPRARIGVMIGAYVLVRIAIIAAAALGYEQLEDSIGMAWLGFCVYTWTAPTMFRWMLRREVQTIQV